MRLSTFAAHLLGAASLVWAGPLLAQAPHDGSWAIEIHTERGACDALYRYYVVVEGQAVRLRSMTGETSPASMGLVRRDGRVNATLGDADDPVNVTGRLANGSGTGVWSAPTRQCTGRWNAHKRA